MLTSQYDCNPCSAAVVDVQPIELQNLGFREEFFPGHFGAQSHAGIEINYERALGHPVILQGIKILAGALAQAEVTLKKRIRTESGKVRIEDVRGHPGGIVARNRSRERQTSSGAVVTICQYRAATMSHAILAGDGWGAIQRTVGGDPMQTTILPPYPDTYPEFDKRGQLKIVTHVQTPTENRKRFEIDPINIFQVQGLSPDGVSGYPLTELAANAIGQGLAGYKYAGKSWANDARPNGVLSTPGFLTDQQKQAMMASWYNQQRGLDNAGEIALLTGGTTYNPMSMTHIDAQLVQYLEHDVKTQSRILNIPPFLLGLTESSGLKMAEAIAWFVQFTLGDWACNWTEQMRIKLLTEGEWKKGDLFFHFDFSRYLMTNWPEFVKTIVEGVGGPVFQRAEGRAMLQINPDVDDEDFLERSTGAPTGAPERETEEPPEPEDQLAAMRNELDRINLDSAYGLCTVESRKISEAAKENGGTGIESQLNEWKQRLSDRFSVETAEEYCESRRKELLTSYAQHGLSAIERDAANSRVRAMRLVEMEMNRNGHRIKAEEV